MIHHTKTSLKVDMSSFYPLALSSLFSLSCTCTISVSDDTNLVLSSQNRHDGMGGAGVGDLSVAILPLVNAVEDI